MSNAKQIFTSESVTLGHPDKLCDRIADEVVDELLRQDPQARAAVEVLATTGLIHVAGEISTSGYVDITDLARKAICDIGYNGAETGFDGNACGITLSIDHQSPDIAAGVSESWEARQGIAQDAFDQQGAGDQGLVFGYACDETPDLLPAPIWLAHRLARKLESVRRNQSLDYLRPDGKTQVTVQYEQGKPVGVQTVVISTQHKPQADLSQLRRDLFEQVIKPTLEKITWAAGSLESNQLKTLINPAGPFVLGGPAADTGVTGRKLIVDTYGGMARHGGGAFSGKDPSKVDRSAAYAARYVAKNIVAAGLATRCELQIAYAIGSARPVSVRVETFGTAKVPECRIEQAVLQIFDLRPAAIIDHLALRRPIYAETAAYGHFGRAQFSWESTDKVTKLQESLLD